MVGSTTAMCYVPQNCNIPSKLNVCSRKEKEDQKDTSQGEQECKRLRPLASSEKRIKELLGADKRLGAANLPEKDIQTVKLSVSCMENVKQFWELLPTLG
jgi:hypothetical protein